MDRKPAKRTLLLTVLDGVELVDARAEVGRVTTEGDLERGQELVHTSQEGLWPVPKDTLSMSAMAGATMRLTGWQ